MKLLQFWGDLVFDDDDEETASEEEWAPPSLQVQRTIERADKHEELMFEEEHKKTEEYNPPRCGNVNNSSTRKNFVWSHSKSRQRRETTICRAAALHPLGYESIRLCATFWDNHCYAFADLGTSVKQVIKIYARWVKSGSQKYGCLMSVIDDLAHQSEITRSEYCVKRVICNKSVYGIDTNILCFCFLRLILLRYM